MTEKKSPAPEHPALPAIQRLAHELRSDADFADWHSKSCALFSRGDRRCEEQRLRAAKLAEAVVLVEGVAAELGGKPGG